MGVNLQYTDPNLLRGTGWLWVNPELSSRHRELPPRPCLQHRSDVRNDCFHTGCHDLEGTAAACCLNVNNILFLNVDFSYKGN